MPSHKLLLAVAAGCCLDRPPAGAPPEPHTTRPTTPLIVPTPQNLSRRPGVAPQSLLGWPVGCDDAGAGHNARLVANLTGGTTRGVAALPATNFIALGLLGEQGSAAGLKGTPFSALAQKHSISAADLAPAGREGYLLDIAQGSCILAAQTERGLANGAQTLLQLLAPDSGTASGALDPSVPALRITDWPSTPVRGAFMFGSPSFQKGVPAASDPGVRWTIALAEYMSTLKLNTGVVRLCPVCVR